MLMIGVLGVVTGTAVNMLGGTATEVSWFLRFVAFGLVETLFCAVVLIVMRRGEPDVPDRVVNLIWYLTVTAVGISVARFFLNADSLGVLNEFALEWLLLICFYIYVSSVFRFMDNVARYYGRPASLSRFDWVNAIGRRLVRYLQRA